jgi:hypothetical protein
MLNSTTTPRVANWSTRITKYSKLLGLAVALAITTSSFAQNKLRPTGDGSYRETLIKEGRNWRLVQIDGVLDTGERYTDRMYMIDGAKGVSDVPLPELFKEDLINQLAESEEPMTFSISERVVEESIISIDQGKPTDALIKMSEAPIDGEIRPDPLGIDAKNFAKSCGNQTISRSQQFNFSQPLNSNFTIGNGFTGSLTSTGNASVNANGQVNIQVKRKKILWICVPYGVSFQSARVWGSATVDHGVTLNGTINYANPAAREWQIAKPFLFSINFWAGPIPVHIGFNLPITAGFDQGGITGSVTGSVTYSGQRSVYGTLDYTCTSSNCTGYSNFNNNNLGSQPITGSISGRFQPSIYAQVAVRGYLYTEGVAYAQVGVRPYLRGDLWGYYGNNCGDANGDGIFETVDALTFDLDWQLYITAQADTFLTSQWNSNLWTSPRWDIAFWDLLGGPGSRALTPMLSGPSVTAVNSSQPFGARMRPCYPYTDPVNYAMTWGDGSPVQNFSGPAASVTNVNHTYNSIGTPQLTLTAVSDSRGRNFNKSTSRTVQVTGLTNKSLSASAAASSTYCVGTGIDCYSPARVNDGNASTALGGFTSWANDLQALPQWVQLTWTNPITVSRVDVYTTAGYALRNFVLQYRTSLTGSWQNLPPVTPPSYPSANTSNYMRFDTATTANVVQVRLLGYNGPVIQNQHIRVNELEVY